MTIGSSLPVFALFCAFVAYPAQLTIRVLEDHTGNPVPSVEVRVSRPPAPMLTADLDTDGEGKAVAPNIQPGTYSIDLKKASFIGSKLEYELPPDTADATVTVRLVRCGAVSGHVAMPADDMGIRAIVVAMRKGPGGQFEATPMTNMASSEGDYRLFNLPPGEYAIAVVMREPTTIRRSAMLFYPDNHSPRVFVISGGDEYRGVDFPLLQGATHTIRGTVQGTTADTFFEVTLVSSEQPGIGFAVAATKPDGSFEIAAVPSGSYDLLVSGPVKGHGYLGGVVGAESSFGRAHVDVAGEGETNVSISVHPGLDVNLSTRTPDGSVAPCKSLRASLSPIETWETYIDVDETLIPGQPKIVHGVPPGEYTIHGGNASEGCFIQSQIADIRRTGQTISVVVGPGGSIKIRFLRDITKPYAVSVYPVDGDVQRQSANTIMVRSGREIVFKNMQPGKYRLSALPQSADSGKRWIADLSRLSEIQVKPGAETMIEVKTEEDRDQ